MTKRRNLRRRSSIEASRSLHHETLEKRELLAAEFGPRLISVATNSGAQFDLAGTNPLFESPREITFRFDGGQELDPNTLSAFRFTASGGDGGFTEGNEVEVAPGFIGFGESSRVVIARFASDLADDQYRISINGFDDTNNGLVALRNVDGDVFQPIDVADPSRPSEDILMNIEVGPRVVAVVPQPIDYTQTPRVQQRDTVHVYFNNDPLGNPATPVITTTGTASDPSVVRPEFYNLFFTNDTVETGDDGFSIQPTSITYEAALNRATLTFAADLDTFTPAGSGTFRLRVGSSGALPTTLPPVPTDLTTDAGDTFTGAQDLGLSFGAAGDTSVTLQGRIDPTRGNTIRWPGIGSPFIDDDRRDSEIVGRADTTDGINTYYYNFANLYGTDAIGNQLENAITPAQQQRTREILDLYSEALGVQFIETEDRGLQIVTGDLRALVETASTGPGLPFQEFRVNDEDPTQGVLILDAGENWFDGYGLSPNENPSWFVEALRGVGSLLGIGNTFTEVPGTASGSFAGLYDPSLFPNTGALASDFSIEPDFLSTSDIIPGQALHRPEIRDADLYRFSVQRSGRVSIESFAERLTDTSLLDSDLKLWRLNPENNLFELVARNDDFFGDDSFIGVDVTPDAGGAAATYVLGITAAGNSDYNPNIAGSGGGGLTQGNYDLRITFQRDQVDTIVDTNDSRLDGDSDGQQGGDFNFWFRVAQTKDTAAVGDPRTLFVSSRDGFNSAANGTIIAPFETIDFALSQARPGDIVRLLPDGGADGNIDTTFDNRAYEIGTASSGAPLADGTSLEVPQGVTVMIDAGSILKLRNAKVSVGSESVDEDRSLAALQVLGAPVIVDADGSVVDGTVDITSYFEETRDGVLLGLDTNPLGTTPAAGDWAGIEFRNDFDYSEGRPVWESEGIFLDYVSHADIRYGGGSVQLTDPPVTPLQMLESRPTLIYNSISLSRDAAISADPNSFEETNFSAPRFQQASLDRFGTTFASDYDRVGPFIRGNTLVDNSINGLFVRVLTPAVGQREPMTVSGRFDDRDITHVLSEVLVLQGQPGGALLLESRPDVLNVTATPAAGTNVGSLVNGETFDYRVTFVTQTGIESLASEPTRSVDVTTSGAVRLENLPAAPDEFAGRRLYRVNAAGDYILVALLDRATNSFLDDGTTRGGRLSEAALATTSGTRLFPRVDARLSIDPGLVVKLDGARIEASFGADFYAEGLDGNPVVFTSRLDDRFGAGGTFDTTNDGSSLAPQPGDWSGLVFRQGSSASIDFATIAFAGGDSATSGDLAFFNPVEILQADVRIAHSRFEGNADGDNGSFDVRDGIGFNSGATIFVRGAQPILVDNTIVDNEGAAISINPDALNFLTVSDTGRGTGLIDVFVSDGDNQGPLIAANKLDNNGINGLLVRNESLTTESVWDDTDIVHVVEEQVYAWHQHHRSGLRLKSDPNRSLVVKMQNGGALQAANYRSGIDDAIGGTLQVIGQPGFPVIITSLSDDSVGAGFTPGGLPQTDTDNQALPATIDWFGLIIQPGANDRNVAFVPEAERAVGTSSSVNAVPATAQQLGSLAQNEVSADENRRLGFNIRGTLSENNDIDVYTFRANGGTEVFIDIDDTTFGLDTVVELIDINGNILALSNSSVAESSTPSGLVNNIGAGSVLPLFKTGEDVIENPNALDAGMRVVLPGNSANPDNQYFIRVRSSNIRPGDSATRLTTPSLVGAGLSRGQYQLSLRLRETDEIAGSTIRLADIRYAFNPIDIPAAPIHSPLAGEHAEELTEAGLDTNDGGTAFNGTEGSAQFANADADPLGNISLSDRGALRVTGVLGNQVLQTNPQFGFLSEQDIDVYRVDLFSDLQEPDIIGENRFISTTFDIDYADQLGRANTSLAVYTADGRLILHSRDSNIADDQGRPTLGNDATNLSGGSSGTLDAYIGPVEMQQGTYFVVVSSAQMIPESLNQLFNANPAESNVRILPINSSRRLAEEGFDEISLDVNQVIEGGEIQQLNTTADVPTVTPLFDETSLVPYKLEDVRLFLTLDGGLTGSNQSTLISVDPFTGQLERTIGQFGQPVGDLAIRRDGELFAYSLGPQTGAQNDGNTGNFLNISSVNAAAAGPDDGLTFRQNNAAGTGTENDAGAQLLYQALAFVPSSNTSATPSNNPTIPAGERAFALGNRDANGRGTLPPALLGNVLYSVVANTGAVTNQGSTNGQLDRDFGNGPYSEFFGPASNRVELGIVDTGQFPDSPALPDGSFVNGGDITGMAIDPIQGQGLIYAVTDEGFIFTFNPFDQRAVDVDGFVFGQYGSVINSTNHGQIEPHPDDFVSTFNGQVEFTSLTLGPRITERAPGDVFGPHAQVLFGVTAQGWIYTMQIDADTGLVAPAHSLVDGNYAVPLVDQFGNAIFARPNGAAFSIREENLWHQTTDRGTDDGHGLFLAPDQSRIRTLGGSSLYFGVQIDGNQANNTIEGGNGTLNPGGAHGSVVSRPLSLEGYAAGDKPTLYFNYFLETEAGQDFDPPSNGINNQQVDAFRVFAAGDDGQWRLLTTNSTYRSFSNVPSDDEYDFFALNGGIPVQEAFDNTDDWRQARVDLSPLAGNKNVQLRFDFSTAGGMHSQFNLTGYLNEVQAVAGTDVVEGTGFSVFENQFPFDFTQFEFVRGAAINIPADPNVIPEGSELTFVDSLGVATTLTLTRGPVGAPTDVFISPTDLSTDIAANIVARLQSLAPTLLATQNGAQILAPEAATFSLDEDNLGDTTAAQYLPTGVVPIFYNNDMTVQEVRDSVRQALANGIGAVDPVTGLSTATIANYPEYGTNRIRFYNQQLVANDSPLGFSTFLPGDEFGAFGSASISNAQVNTRPASNNNVEGVYLDDIVIGFAERGEVIYNAPVNRNFDVLPETRTFTFTDEQVPEFGNEILVGSYTLEVRKSSDYGVPEDYDPIRLVLDEQFGKGRSFDTNDRLANGAVTLIAPSGADLVDGDTFVLSNGTARLTFEFDSNNNVSAGRVRVPFTPTGTGANFSADSDEDSVVATSIRDAINSPQAFNVLGILASGRDGSQGVATTSNRVELFGDSIQVNPSSGRFLKVDLVAEETFYGRESARSIPVVDHDADTVIDDIFFDTFARATVTDYVNGATDTLVAVGKIGDRVGTVDANVVLLDLPEQDVDVVKIFLNAGNTIDVDLDTIGWNLGTVFDDSLLEIFQDVPGDDPVLLPTVPSLRSNGETNDGVSINGFQAPATGYYYVRVLSNPGFFFFDGSFGEYQLTIRPTGAVQRDVLMVDYHFDFGDTNQFRDQGQLIIESNFISNFGNIGIRATYDPGAPNIDDDVFFTSTPLDRRPGAAATLRNPNTERLLPGTVITNNVIISDGGTGILFSGEVAASGDSPAPVPFGRIVNNTVVGSGSGTGILISDATSPTILNNIVSDFATGINIDASSLTTVVGGNAFQGNGTNSNITISNTNFDIPAGEPLFQDPDGGIYIPAAGSDVIDSSFASLNDRSNFVNTVKQPVGISSSPIIAPSFDAFGIPRFDDPAITTPGGVGANVFIDRGAIDRADFVRPIARLVSPLDFISSAGASVDGGDIDPSESFVRLTGGTVEFFEIQMFDPSGSGPDARTVTEDSVLLTENGRRLVPGVDYTFGYSDNSRLIRLTPLAGLWRSDAVYEITLNNETRIAYQAPAGADITDGDQVIVVDDDGNRSVFEFESGFALQVPQTTLLTIEGPNTSFLDRDTFTITAPGGNSLTFEINLSGATAGGRVPVQLAAAGTVAEVRDAILASFALPAPGAPGLTVSEFLDLDPVSIGFDQIQLGTLDGHSVALSTAALTTSGVAGGVTDGQTFTYTTATETVTFEFNSTGGLLDTNNVAIDFSRQDTPSQIGEAIVAAVRSQPIGLGGAVASDNGTVILGGAVTDTLDVTASSLAVNGSPGVTGPLTLTVAGGSTGTSLDGNTFSITSGGTTLNFRYTTDPNLASADQLIILDAADLETEIATKTAAAIAQAFPGELNPTASADVITLGEPSSSVSGEITSVNPGTSGLIIDGISGGAIQVNFLPNSPPTSIAATLQSAIAAAPVNVDTFEAGGGTILISGAASLQGTFNGSAPVDVGVSTPAITDLAGNAIQETRSNEETRFTIIMPEVVFDLGDAPASYSTLIADNGARHTIGPNRSPRLGDFIDSEDDGQPVNQDDVPLSVLVTPVVPGGGLPIFSVDPLTIPDTVLTTLDEIPVGGETLVLTIGGVDFTFELVQLNANPGDGNIPVTFSPAESLSEITTKLVNAIRAEVPQTDDGLLIGKNTDTSFTITSIDDEDGVQQGILLSNGSVFNVFTRRGTDPTNVQPQDVLGFLNPLDPAGTNIDVKVFGAGLLHAWIDFDQSGTFEADEQVVRNLPVSGDDLVGSFNTITVFTPGNAVDGDTWMRVRISESGNLTPTGVAIGGEVEDYLVEVISIDLPNPDDDVYNINEDALLDTIGQGLPSIADGDLIPTSPPPFLPVQYIAGDLPINGTLVSLDAQTGHFVYQPNPDFNGVDTFTYRLSTQQNESASSISLDSFATVTINVAAINDAPGGADSDFTAQEDLPLTISADQLLVGATPDADPMFVPPAGGSGNATNDGLQNEINQTASLRVTSVLGSGATPITAANAASAPGNLVVSANGTGLDLQVTDPTAGDLISLGFAGQSVTFQLVAVGATAQAGVVAIDLIDGESAADLAVRLATEIENQFAATSPPLAAAAVGDTVTVSFTPLAVSASASDPAKFTFSSGSAGSQTIEFLAAPTIKAAPSDTDPTPADGDTVTITVDGVATVYEFIAPGATATGTNVGVTLLAFQDPTSPAAIAAASASLAAAVHAGLLASDVGLDARVADGTTAPNVVDITPANVSAGKSFETNRGSVIALFDTFGGLIELRYLSGQDLNRDNPPPAAPPLVDQFTFVVQDNGVSIDIVNNRYVYGTPLSADPATATIDVAPQNDPPLLLADLISVGPLGPDADTVTTDWENFGGATPTEDQVLTIDPAFLLLNDSRGPVTAGDENTADSLNDTALAVRSVTLVDPAQGTIELVGGQIIFTPADDIFGDVIFTYSAEDAGIDEGLDASRPVVPLTSINGTATISIQPVNDSPVAFNRTIEVTESANPGTGPAFTFTSDRLIVGAGTEFPNQSGDFADDLAAPFDESEQTPNLRVASFTTVAGTVDESMLTGVGTEILTLESDTGGIYEFEFVDGVFTIGRFTTTADYNNQAPFDVIDALTYVIADDGLTTDPQNGNQFNLPSARSDDDPMAIATTITFVVDPANDAPTFTIPDVEIDVLERDDLVGTMIDGFAIDILPGPATALDEADTQDVSFSFPVDLNGPATVPDGLFTQLPTLSPTGTLTVFPAPDAIGTAVLVVQATDSEPDNPAFVPTTTLATFTVTVRPVNDAPRFDPNVAGTSDMRDADDAYSVASIDVDNDGQIDSANITYTLREDNTQAQGVVEPYFIPLRRLPSVGYSLVGLLDVFTVGPDNEAGDFEGGNQTLEFLSAGNDPAAGSLDRTTDRGGILTPVFDDNDELIGLNYQPPKDFNISFAGTDSFTYFVRDDNPNGGETFDLDASGLVPDRLTTSNRVELILNPVNDRPEFQTATLNLSVQEDAALIEFTSYATNIFAGPPNTAFDEVDVNTGQLVEFTVTSLDFPQEDSDDFFSTFPTIDEQSGQLTFRPAPNVFGEFRFEVVLSDQNRDGTISDNTTRGDLISSIPVTMTISVNPVNDPPLVDPNSDPLSFSILEDGVFEILIDGDNTNPGLLDVFRPGPDVGATDESADIAPRPGGNQTVSLGTPVPTSSAQGGTLELVTTGGSPRLVYRPRANFVGVDSFIYTVTDDGQTVDINGNLVDDPRIAANTVTFEVLPVNDAPLFGGAANVTSVEDGGVIEIPGWASNVQAGPTTATDEIDGIDNFPNPGNIIPAQALTFDITQVSANADLFLVPPSAVIDTVTGEATLTYQTRPDANGLAVFEVVLRDDGPNSASNGDQFLSTPPRTFTIDVTPVNDPPSFALVNDQITRAEDSGPFSTLQATNISPGPSDEGSQTVTFEIEPLGDAFTGLFSEPPTINPQGILRFTPAPNRNTDNINGPVPISVIARDSEGAVTSAMTFSIAITEVNDPPVANSDPFTSDEDTILTLTVGDLLANDTDPDLLSNENEFITVVMPAVQTSGNGATVRFDSATGVITYDPTDRVQAFSLQGLAPGESLLDTFSYSLVDSAGLTSNLTSVAITVNGINDAPILGPDTPTLNPDGSTTIRVLDNDSDIDGTIDPTSLRISLQPAFGSVEILEGGVLVYTPFGTFSQEDIFRYTVADNLGLESEGTVTISSNASPIAVNDAAGTFLEESLVINVAANDSDPPNVDGTGGVLDLASIEIVRPPNRGSAIPQSDGTVLYIPGSGFTGVDSFTYRISDTQGRPSNVATVNLQVVASRLQNPDRFSDVNDDGFVTALDALLIINRLARDTDGDGRIPVVETDRGPNFFDRNGDQTITSLDALQVINELARINNGSEGEGEFVPVSQSIIGPGINQLFAGGQTVNLDGHVQITSSTAKLVDASEIDSVDRDVLDLIAWDHQSDDDSSDDDSLSAIDAALIDLV